MRETGSSRHKATQKRPTPTIRLPQPLRVATPLRRLLATPVASASALLCLALGLAVLALVGAVADAFLFRPLPFPSPERLVQIWVWFERNPSERYFLKPKDVDFLRDDAETIDVGAWQPVDFDVAIGSRLERASGAKVTGEFFPVLGIRPATGRLISPHDVEQQSGAVVLSSRAATRWFSSAAESLGETVRVDGVPRVVVGVAEARSHFPSGADLWVPVSEADWTGQLGFSLLGRVRPNSSAEEALAEARSLGSRLVEVDPDRYAKAGLDGDRLEAVLLGDLGPTIRTLLLAGACLFAIAWANASCLALARGLYRAPVRALQRALGAAKRRLLLELVAEYAVVVGLAAVSGVAVAKVALRALLELSPVEINTFSPVMIDGRVHLVVAAAALVVLGGLVLAGNLESSAGAPSASQRVRGAPRRLAGLVVGDIAVTTMLLVGAALLFQAFLGLVRVDPGFAVDRRFAFTVSAPATRSETHAQRVRFAEEVERAVLDLPEVTRVGAAHRLPMDAVPFYLGFSIEGRPPENPADTELDLHRVVTPGYLAALGAPLLEGRDLAASDDHVAPPVALVNQAFARRYFDGESAVGRRFKPGPYGGDAPWITIVGVSGDVRELGLHREVPSTLFIPLAQRDRRYLARMSFVAALGTEDLADPLATLQRAVATVDREAVVFDVETLEQLVAGSLQRQRFALVLVGVFAILALVLAGAGLYGVMSFEVRTRQGEMGVRLALGADPFGIRKRIVYAALARGALGLGLGLALATAASRWLDSLLPEIATADAATMAWVAVMVLAVVVAASDPAARRAARVDPAKVLLSS